MTNQTRRVKLHSQSREGRHIYNGTRQVPWLNVSGVWLERAGFNIGQQIEITVGDRELIIKPLR